jgi:hypothetical protein
MEFGNEIIFLVIFFIPFIEFYKFYYEFINLNSSLNYINHHFEFKGALMRRNKISGCNLQKKIGQPCHRTNGRLNGMTKEHVCGNFVTHNSRFASS